MATTSSMDSSKFMYVASVCRRCSEVSSKARLVARTPAAPISPSKAIVDISELWENFRLDVAAGEKLAAAGWLGV